MLSSVVCLELITNNLDLLQEEALDEKITEKKSKLIEELLDFEF